MKTNKWVYILALFLLLASPVGVGDAQINNGVHSPYYLKVMAFKANFADSFHVYIFGDRKRKKVYNRNYFDIPYNSVIFIQLDKNDNIIKVKR